MYMCSVCGCGCGCMWRSENNVTGSHSFLGFGIEVQLQAPSSTSCLTCPRETVLKLGFSSVNTGGAWESFTLGREAGFAQGEAP